MNSRGSVTQAHNRKKTQISWASEVPSHWNVVRLKDVATVVNGYPFDSALFHPTDGMPLVRIRDIARGFTEAYYIGEPVTEALIERGDIVIGMDGDFNVAQWSGVQALLNQRLCVVRASSSALERYIYYVLPVPLKIINELTYATTVKHLSSFDVEKMRVPLPPSTELLQIVQFLDNETAEADVLVAKYERLIQLLEEKRIALITQAVTKGLDANAPLKESGIEWIGMMPTHWTAFRLKLLLSDIKAGPFGSALTKDMYSSSGYRVYGQEQVIPNDFTIGDYYIAPEKYVELRQYRIMPGDILISCVGTFGKIAIVPQNIEPGIINPRLLRLRCSGAVNAQFLAAVMRSAVVYEQLLSLSRGGTMDIINIGTLSEIRLPLPPLDEQNNITAYIEEESAELRGLQQRAERAIALIQERRSALVTAAVTGQIDVRNYRSETRPVEVSA